MNLALTNDANFARIITNVLPWFEMTDLRPEMGDQSHFGVSVIPELSAGCVQQVHAQEHAKVCNQSLVTLAALDVVRHLASNRVTSMPKQPVALMKAA